MLLETIQFDYQTIPLRDLRIIRIEEEDENGRTKTKTHVEHNGHAYDPSNRFWNSMFSRYQFSKSIFNYFEPDEVVDRIVKVSGEDKIQLCVERNGNNGDKKSKFDGRLLAISNPDKSFLGIDKTRELIEKYSGQAVGYHDGIVESTHTPRVDTDFSVGGDAFKNRFTLNVPIDGYGNPAVYLGLFRPICTNGLVAYIKMFRSEIPRGKDDAAPNVDRTLEGFGNDDGYAALRSRMNASALSWASLGESHSLYSMLTNLYSTQQIGDEGGLKPEAGFLHKMFQKQKTDKDFSKDLGEISPIINAYNRMTGDCGELYGIANSMAISSRQQTLLPMQCTVYDLINFATEVATHHSLTTNGSRMLQAWVGGRVADEYNLEGTKSKYAEFRDFHITSKLKTNRTGSR